MNRLRQADLNQLPAYLIAILIGISLFSAPIYAKVTILADTTWYSGQVIDTGGLVEIDHGATLTVQGGVTISNNTFFIVLGNLLMKGTEVNPIVIDDGHFCFYTNHETPGYIEFDNVVMNNGGFSEAGGCSGYGYFKLKNSKFYGVSGFYLWYPVAPSEIIKNIFAGSDGLQGILSGPNTLHVSNNVFVNQLGSAVSSYANYDDGFFVRYNSFLSTDKTALEIQAGYDSASMIADNNYFGTTDVNNIEERILDRKDSLTRASFIEFSPFLNSPHPDTPIYTPQSYILNVSKEGQGSGTVTSNFPGIDCGSNCSSNFDYGEFVTLTATPNYGSFFSGWTGSECFGIGTCTLKMDRNKTVTAIFTKLSYTIGGSVSGLNGSVVLQNNGGDNLTVSSNGPFMFFTALDYGSNYAVTVLTQPTGQTCTVSNGTGTANANVTDIAISCIDNPPPAPMNVQATAGIGSITVTFNTANPSSKSASLLNSSITFTANCTSNNGGVSGSATGTSSPLVVTGVTPGKAYTCTVSATGSGGTSTSTPSNVVIPTGDPTPIPTLSEWAQILLALSLMGMAGWYWHGRAS